MQRSSDKVASSLFASSQFSTAHGRSLLLEAMINLHGERDDHVAARAIRKAVDALVEAEDWLADDHALVLELLAAASALVAGEGRARRGRRTLKGKAVRRWGRPRSGPGRRPMGSVSARVAPPAPCNVHIAR